MISLIDLEKKINSELTTKIKKTQINHNQIYLEIEKEHLIDVTLFIKSNKDTKFRQLIDITAVDYPEQSQRFKVVYLFLSHEFNQRMILSYSCYLLIDPLFLIFFCYFIIPYNKASADVGHPGT